MGIRCRYMVNLLVVLLPWMYLFFSSILLLEFSFTTDRFFIIYSHFVILTRSSIVLCLTCSLVNDFPPYYTEQALGYRETETLTALALTTKLCTWRHF